MGNFRSTIWYQIGTDWLQLFYNSEIVCMLRLKTKYGKKALSDVGTKCHEEGEGADMATKRFRLKFMFWLDMGKSDEAELAEEIEALKEHRLFSETIRDGIRLICDLRSGRTDRLFVMFPWIAGEVDRGVAAQSQSVQQELERLWGALASQSVVPGTQSNSRPISAGGLAAALPGDDEIKLQVKAVKNGTSGKNFLSSLMSLQQ